MLHPEWGKSLGPLWLSLFGGQDQLNPRKMVSRFGFAPKPHSSGTSVKKSDQSAGFGNAEVRKVIHQAALIANNYQHYQAYYEKKKAEGKDHLLIINNIINKLIKMYCGMWNRRQE